MKARSSRIRPQFIPVFKYKFKNDRWLSRQYVYLPLHWCCGHSLLPWLRMHSVVTTPSRSWLAEDLSVYWLGISEQYCKYSTNCKLSAGNFLNKFKITWPCPPSALTTKTEHHRQKDLLWNLQKRNYWWTTRLSRISAPLLKIRPPRSGWNAQMRCSHWLVVSRPMRQRTPLNGSTTPKHCVI